MRIARPTINFGILALFPFFLFLISASAQEIVVNYRFLETEVVDTGGKPVAGAVVETIGFRHNTLQTLQTDRDGRLPKGMPVSSGHINTIGYRVSKPGYFPFEDIFGTVAGPFSDRLDRPIKLELLIEPRTVRERTAVELEQRKREFMAAARKGDSATVRRMLIAGADPNTTTSDLRGVPGPKQIPAIVWAAIYGESETILALLAAGADVRRKGNFGHKALMYYLNSPFYISRYPRTELERAGTKPVALDNEIVRMLIERGADLEAVGDRGETPLMLAAGNGTLPMVKMLLDRRVASINAKDQSGNTALIRAVDNSVAGEERFFTRAPKGIKDFRNASTNSRAEIVKLLLRAGADPDLISSDAYKCESAIMNAASRGHLDLISVLVEHKATVNLACPNGDTALIQAVRNHRVKVVQTLIEAGANVKSKQGAAALAYAKEQMSVSGLSEYQKIVRLLEAAGAQ